MPNTTTSETYRQLQKDAGLSNSKASEWLDLDISTIKRYRNGDLEAPSLVIKSLKYLIKYGDINEPNKK